MLFQGEVLLGSLLYQIVADQIREKINARDWMAKLPSEAELCKMFNVSRITLRRSIQELCNEGLVMKRHGLGMYVEKDDYNPDKISADRLFSSACHYRTIQVLRNIKPGGGAAKALLLKPGEKVVEAQRLSYYGDIPVSYLTIRIQIGRAHV
jgi:DNA-binding GntR family transcriptional regulator